MKKLVAASLVACSGIISSQATVLFSDSFNSYTDGNLIGQGNWVLVSSAVNPIQVNSGVVSMVATGQDLASALPGGVYTLGDNTSFYIGLDLNVSAAGTGDYFLHTTPAPGNTGTLVDRLELKSSGAGFVLGYLEQSGTGGVINYGATVLNFGTSYRVVLAYNDVAGPLNDTASLYVNPSDTTTEANNLAYLANDTWTTTTAESDAIGTLNLRQGATGAASSETVDNLDGGTSFADAATFHALPTPEPTSLALMGLGGVAGAFFFGRRNKK
jgi:PEP-CTERM motif